uniref:DUF4203 domain-containing protein n=1 Tax=Trichobilharzia regenti TaxID=157069 RepID=A0AA85J837_TRIRE|nr:unnamed protein product [Trichobilharzia regenti]
MVDTCPFTVPQNVIDPGPEYYGKSVTSCSHYQARHQSSDVAEVQTSFSGTNQSNLQSNTEGMPRNHVPTYTHSNLIRTTDSIPYVRSCPNMGDYHIFDSVNNNNNSVRLFNSQFLTSCPPAIHEVQSDASQDENVSRRCCFCTCAPLLPKAYCTNTCCSKPNCLISSDSLCSVDTLFCLFLPGSCKCRLFSFPRHRITNENLIILSIIQLLCGFAAIVLSSVALTKAVFLYQMATGLWAGILMVVTGLHGLFAARRPVVCALIGLLVLCMIVSLAACVLICVSVAGTIEDGFLGSTASRKAFPREIIRISSGFRENATSSQKYEQRPSMVTLTPRSPGWSEFDQVQLWDFKNVLRETPDSYLRTCQIILHLLLLLVGILEASVSLATSILCCRCVCSNSTNFRFQNSRSLRTNIVSFNAATANQAASVLRSGAVNDFVGSGNVILALNTDVPVQNNASSNITEAILQPQIHHTLIPFLSDLNRHSLILTQAGTGTIALSAARAAANLVDTRRFETQHGTSFPCSSNNEQSSVQRPHTLGRNMFNRLRGCRLNRSNESRPRLLYTTLHIPANLSNDSDSFPNPPPFSPSTTIVYVMPSPTHEEPPMIFPPFPPSYSESQKKSPLTTSINRIQRNQSVPLQPHPPRRLRRRLVRYGISRARLRSRLSRLFCRQNSRQCNSLWTANNSRRSRVTCHLSRSVASAPISVGDRLIQPVLIIGDPGTARHSEDPPPKYSR